MDSETPGHLLLTTLFEVIPVTLCHISSSKTNLSHLLHREQMLRLLSVWEHSEKELGNGTAQAWETSAWLCYHFTRSA